MPTLLIPGATVIFLCSYDRSQMDAAELADLLSQVACFAPGQSFHVEGQQTAAPGGCSSAHGHGSTSSGSEGSSSASGAGSRRQLVDPARLGGAMRRSLVCVAAFAEEQHLPQHQHLAARGLASAPEPSQQQQARQRERLAGGWSRPRRTRRVLVGFARAVGDATLVATGAPERPRAGQAACRGCFSPAMPRHVSVCALLTQGGALVAEPACVQCTTWLCCRSCRASVWAASCWTASHGRQAGLGVLGLRPRWLPGCTALSAASWLFQRLLMCQGLLSCCH